MTYEEFSNIEAKRRHLISRKRSLEMTIRMNKAWMTNRNSVRGQKRLAKIEAAEKELASLVVPPKPKHPIGYEVRDEERDFVGFFALDDRQYILEYLEQEYGHCNFELIPSPRYRDDKKKF